MKKMDITLLKILVAVVAATGMACVLMIHDASDNAIIVTFFSTAIAVSAVLGVFDLPAIKRGIKHNNRNQYQKAA